MQKRTLYPLAWLPLVDSASTKRRRAANSGYYGRVSIAKALFQVDLICGLAAGVWGLLAMPDSPDALPNAYAQIVSAKAAFGFAFVALLRGLNSAKAALEAVKE